MKTDCQRTLQLLREAGKAGIHSFDLNSRVGTTRAAARIDDLKRQGHKISAVYERRGNSLGVRYFLTQKVNKKVEDHWDFSTGKAIWIEHEEPKQERMFA